MALTQGFVVILTVSLTPTEICLPVVLGAELVVLVDSPDVLVGKLAVIVFELFDFWFCKFEFVLVLLPCVNTIIPTIMPTIITATTT